MSYSLTHELISSFDKLESEITTKEHKEICNPIKRLITPEWYYAKGFKINFNNMENLFFNQTFKNTLEKEFNNYSIDYQNDAFEKTLSSWYIPYHYVPRDKWGIHLRLDSLINTIKKLNPKLSSFKSQEMVIQASTIYFLIHEVFHYMVENTSTVIEIIKQNPLLYKQYLVSVYEKTLFTDNCIEESLANRYLETEWINYKFPKNVICELLSYHDTNYKKHIYYEEKKFFLDIRRLISQILYSHANPKIVEPLEVIMNIINTKNMKDHQLPLWIHYYPQAIS
jgi:hypothetical protein